MENNTIKNELDFVWNKYNPEKIKFDFKNKYELDGNSSAISDEFSALKVKTAENISREKTFEIYKIKTQNLFTVYKILEYTAKKLGVNIEYLDLTKFKEDEYYENNKGEEEKHAETARSDGKNLILEKDLTKAGGIQGRIYDLIHLAFGHMVQWSTDDKDMLLTKEEAWAIGYRNHENSPDRVLDLMSLYEFEAGIQGICALSFALKETIIEKSEKERILQYFTDYVYCDRDYIIQHYRGNHESFQKFWKFGNKIPPIREIPRVTKFIERHAVEIGLIRDKQK